MAEIFLDLGDAVELEDVLIALRNLLAWAVVVGLLALVVAFVYAILWPLNKLVQTASFGAIGSVPGTHAVEQAVSSALGSAVASFDAQVGSFWHGLKTIVDEVAQEVFGVAALLGYLTWYLTIRYPLHVLEAGLKDFGKVGQVATRIAIGAEKIALRAERIAKSTAEGVYPRLRTVEHEIDNVLQPEITTARELAQSATDAATSAWDYLKTHPWTVVTDAFVGAVAVALTSLGLGGLRCPSFLNSLANRGCGLFNGLESLLGWLVDLLVITDLCDVPGLMETAVSDIATPAVALLTEGIADLPCVSGNEPPVLTVPQLYLPSAAQIAFSVGG